MSHLPHPSILIADDDRDFRETLEGIFQPRGFRTLLASDGQEALEIVRADEIHVVVLDNHMPRLSGLETLKIVHEWRRDLPCILLSARMDENTRQQAQAARVFNVLSKPVSRADITSVVASALQQTYGWNLAALNPATG